MNLIKRFNEMEDLLRIDLYQILTELFDEMEQKTLEINNMILEKNNDNVEIIISHNKQETAKFKYEYPNIEIIGSKNIIFEITNKYMARFLNNINDKTSEYFAYVKTEKEFNLLKKRRMFIMRKYLNTFKITAKELSFELNKDLENFIIENDILNNYLENNNLENNKDIKEENDIVYNKIKSFSVRKIFDYKKLEKLAMDNGYEYKWSNGSHKIFEHYDTNKIIVIPSHRLGLGLSIKIQKQIYNNLI